MTPLQARVTQDRLLLTPIGPALWLLRLREEAADRAYELRRNTRAWMRGWRVRE